MTAIDLCTILVKTCVMFRIKTAYFAGKIHDFGLKKGTCV